MEKWMIDKQFDLCYGHRVHSQELNGDFCENGNTQTFCRHLHGHQGKVHVFLEGTKLERGMVTDFKHLGWLKNFLDSNLDHKFVLDINDPIFCKLLSVKSNKGTLNEYEGLAEPLHLVSGEMFVDVICEDDPTKIFTSLKLLPVYVPGTDHIAGWNLDVENSKLKGAEKEVYEGYFLVNFVPTSENFCKWLFDITSTKMAQIGVKVARVDWFETPKSRSSYGVQGE